MKRNKLKYWMFLLSENSQCADRWEEFSSIGWRDLCIAPDGLKVFAKRLTFIQNFSRQIAKPLKDICRGFSFCGCCRDGEDGDKVLRGVFPSNVWQ